MDCEPRRLFLREPGWRVHLKSDSQREFCYAAAPGQDYYHRLQMGEVFVALGEEKLCIPCATRRGLIEHEPRFLRDPIDPITLDAEGSITAFELRPPGSDL